MTDQPRDAKRCKHYWNYPHAQIAGRTRNETVVVRYCEDCKARQMARCIDWRPATGDYKLDKHLCLSPATQPGRRA